MSKRKKASASANEIVVSYERLSAPLEAIDAAINDELKSPRYGQGFIEFVRHSVGNDHIVYELSHSTLGYVGKVDLKIIDTMSTWLRFYPANYRRRQELTPEELTAIDGEHRYLISLVNNHRENEQRTLHFEMVMEMVKAALGLSCSGSTHKQVVYKELSPPLPESKETKMDDSKPRWQQQLGDYVKNPRPFPWEVFPIPLPFRDVDSACRRFVLHANQGDRQRVKVDAPKPTDDSYQSFDLSVYTDEHDIGGGLWRVLPSAKLGEIKVMFLSERQTKLAITATENDDDLVRLIVVKFFADWLEERESLGEEEQAGEGEGTAVTRHPLTFDKDSIKPFPTQRWKAWKRLNYTLSISLTIECSKDEWETWLRLNIPRNSGELPLPIPPLAPGEPLPEEGIFYYYSKLLWGRVFLVIAAKSTAHVSIPLALDDLLTNIGEDFPETRGRLSRLVQPDDIHRELLPQLSASCDKWAGDTAVNEQRDFDEETGKKIIELLYWLSVSCNFNPLIPASLDWANKQFHLNWRIEGEEWPPYKLHYDIPDILHDLMESAFLSDHPENFPEAKVAGRFEDMEKNRGGRISREPPFGFQIYVTGYGLKYINRELRKGELGKRRNQNGDIEWDEKDKELATIPDLAGIIVTTGIKAVAEVRTPKKGTEHWRRWIIIWQKIKTKVDEGMSTKKIAKWLQKMHPELPCSERTVRDIIKAGEAGLLD